MPLSTWDEARDLGLLDSVIPFAVFSADLFPGDDGILARQSIKEDLLTKLWSGLPGAPTGPNGTMRPEDLLAIPWLASGITLNVARGGRPAKRKG